MFGLEIEFRGGIFLWLMLDIFTDEYKNGKRMISVFF